MKYTVLQEQNILDALALMSPEASKTTFRSWIKEERVSVDNEVVTTSKHVVTKGQVILLGARKKYASGGIKIIYEDRDIVVIEKPAGLLTVATAFEKEETVHGFLKNHYFPCKVHVVHRLDQDTSGVMLFALSIRAYEKLKEIFEKHDIERCYTAIVEGKMVEERGTWESQLVEDDNYVVHSTSPSNKEGRLAVTHYEVEQSYKRFSWLTLTLETGRKNQIRVQARDAGHPVVGDKKYGAQANPLNRLCLHAHLLAFEHPITKKKMRFESPIPSSFLNLLGRY
jgi:23S rRNA pseudouridine1911/1915/1917 synthase